MVLMKGRTGERPAMDKPEFPLGHASEPAHVSGNASHRWSDKDGAYKSGLSAQLVRSASDASPYQTQPSSSSSSPGSGTNSAAGRPRNGSSSSTIDPSILDTRTSFGDHSASTRTWEGRNYKQYHIPIRRGNSTTSSPTKKSQGTATPALSPLPESANVNRYRASEIGMALGSPTHPPKSAEVLWRPQVLTPATPTGSVGDNNTSGLTRSKSKKWNPFSRSRSKRSKPQDDNSTRALGTDARNNGQPERSIGTAQPEDILGDQRRVESNGDNKRAAKYFPIVTFQPEPEQAVLASAESFNGDIPEPVTHDTIIISSVAQGITVMSSQYEEETTTLGIHEPLDVPYLNVDIPSIEMERYSVMFSSLLQQQQPSPLPARRQVKLDKLSVPTAGEFQENAAAAATATIGLPRPRRATSLPKNSPTFSLFPNDIKPTVNAQNPSPRMRSNTSPAKLDFTPPTTPQRQEAAKPKSSPTVIPTRSATVKVESSTTQIQRERLISKFNRKEFPPGIGSSTTSSRGHDEPHNNSSNEQPAFKAPDWQPSRPEDPPNHSQSIKKQRSPLSPHAEQTSDKNLASEDDATKNELNEAVKISIARQISISRQQRRMLVPLNHIPRGRANSATEAALRVAVGEGNRLAETNRSTPKLVNPDDDGGSPRRMNRKSSRVVVEGVGEKKRLVETNRSTSKVVCPDHHPDTSQKKSLCVVLEGM